jgi:polysaccharide export outer membrane protein
MMSVIQLLRRWSWVCACVLAALAFSGCQSDPVFAELTEAGATGAAASPANPDNSDRLQVGDVLSIVLSDLPTGPAMFDQPIPEAGTITLLLNQHFSVVGKTRSALEQEIRAAYVPKYYVNMTVNIKPVERFIYVDGEVKGGGRLAYTPTLTVLKAIATAGYFTDFAKKTKVRVTRADGRTFTVDCVKAQQDPSKDLPVYPNDKIHVPRRLL